MTSTASRLLRLALLTVLPLSACAADIDRAGWQEDYAGLKNELEQRYAHLAWLASPASGVDLKSIDARAQRKLAAAADENEARGAIQEFIAAMHDGHLSSSPLGKPAAPSKTVTPPADLSQADAMTACAALGYAPMRTVSFSLPFETLPGMRLDADGLSRAFRSGTMKTADGTVLGFVRIARFRPQDASPTLCTESWPHRPLKDGALDSPAFASMVQEAWLRTLAEALRKLKAAGAQVLVVDIGGNSGGNDSGDWAVRLLTNAPVRSARLYVVAHEAGKGYFDEALRNLNGLRPAAPAGQQAVEEARNYFTQGRATLPQRHCDMRWAWSEKRAWNPDGCSNLAAAGFASGRADYLSPASVADEDVAQVIYWPSAVEALRGAWTGPAYVITDARTGSSAEMFAALAQDRGVARTVGTATDGDGCGFMGESPRHVMPHLRLKIAIPNCVRLRADGSDEVKGVAPDIQVAPTDGESERERAARAIGAILRDAASPAKQ